MKRTLEDQIVEDLEIEEKKINLHLRTTPQLYYKYAELRSSAKTELKRLQLDLRLLKSQVTSNLIKFAKKKPTLKSIEIEISLDDEVVELEERIIELEDIIETYNNALNAINKKHESVRELSMNLRKDFLDV